ncbi:MAG: peptidylprolyl isomerase [Candidatus Nanohaloarchaea archaeon]
MKEGEMVLIEYTGKAEGEVFDTTVKEEAEKAGIQRDDADFEPVPVLLGEEYVIEGLEEALLDMEVGDEKELTIPPEKAYGERDSDNIETYPEREFRKQDVQVNVGEEIMIGRKRGRVVSKGSGRVRVDFNHPLSGKELDYWVKVVEKVEDDGEIAENIYSYRVGHGDIEIEDGVVKVPRTHSHGDHEHELPENVLEELREEILEHTDLEEVEFV